jgi:hypothetical protein
VAYFFSCHDSLLALQTAGLDNLITTRVQRCHTAAELVFSICAKENHDTTGCFALILWVVWRNRNDKVWNDVKESGRSLGIAVLQQWNSVQQHSHSTTQQQLPTSSWQKPAINWYKCNVDAGFNKVLNR